jgi:hypothetical protein
MSPESGRNSGGDLFGMAKDGTTVPDDAAKPRIIPSVPCPGQYGTTLAEAADNTSDIPRVSFLRHSYRETYSASYSSDVMLASLLAAHFIVCFIADYPT